MNICSLQYFLGCCLVPIFFHLLDSKLHRQIFLSVLNLAFLGTFIKNAPSAIGFVLFIFGTYGTIWLIRKRPSGLIGFLSITSVLAVFLLVKKYSFVSRIVPSWLFDHTIEMVGISYMLFKYIHVLVDAYQGQIEQISFFSYANYQLSFFALVVGPIQRYNDYHRGWVLMDSGPGDSLQIYGTWNRLLNGIIKMGGIATIAIYFHDLAGKYWGPQPPAQLALRFLLFFYSYAIFLYFNFSGAIDIAIGSARLFGFELPENFNQPYLARNVIDFWNRWHMTLTHWIRDYVFMTSYKLSVEWFPRGSKYIGYFLLFFSLFLAGVWHGSTVNFAIFGFIHGVGAMVVQIYGDLLKWRLGRAGYQRYMKNEWIRWIGIAVTFHYFCFSLLFFALGARQVWNILKTVWQGVFW